MVFFLNDSLAPKKICKITTWCDQTPFFIDLFIDLFFIGDEAN